MSLRIWRFAAVIRCVLREPHPVQLPGIAARCRRYAAIFVARAFGTSNAGLSQRNNVACRCRLKVAERKGFEPLIQLSPYGALAKRCLQPLGHLSGAGLMTRIDRKGQTGRRAPTDFVYEIVGNGGRERSSRLRQSQPGNMARERP